MRTLPPAFGPLPPTTTDVSPNTVSAGYAGNIDALPSPQARLLRGEPSLQLNGVLHTVRIPETGKSVRRLACFEMALDPSQQQKVIAHARSKNQAHTFYPACELRYDNEPIPDGLERHGRSLMLDPNGENKLIGEPNLMPSEAMIFPGTNKLVSVFGHELYQVTAVPTPEPEKKAKASSFFSGLASSLMTSPPEVELQISAHQASVPAFRFGQNGKYLLYRQLEKTSGKEDAVKQNQERDSATPALKRKLYVPMHGFMAPKNVPDFKPPVDLDIPEEIKISSSTPMGHSRVVDPVNVPTMDLDGRLESMFSKWAGKDKGPRIFSLEDMRNHWLVHNEQSVNQGEHAIRFMASGLTGDDSATVTPAMLRKLATGLEPEEGTGKMRNILFMPLAEDPVIMQRELNLPPPGTRESAYQRGLTPDRMARLAYNADPTKAPVDVLTLDYGKHGNLAGILHELKALGVLDQYDEIYIDACKDDPGHSNGPSPSWKVNDHIPDAPVATTLIINDENKPVMTHIDPAHAGKIG